MMKKAREVIAEYFYCFPPCAPTRDAADERARLVDEYLVSNGFVILRIEAIEQLERRISNLEALTAAVGEEK